MTAIPSSAAHALPIEIRLATVDDVPAMLAIYAHHVQHGLATFEEIVPDRDDFSRRWQSVAAAGLPWLVAIGAIGAAGQGEVRQGEGSQAAGVDAGAQVLGYAYAAPYRARSAYRFTLEDSIYIRDGLRGRGVGRKLLTELLVRCESGPWRQMMAVIGDSANAASLGLHRTVGFVDAGVQRAVGFKFGRWVDTVQMQRPLGTGDATLPDR